MSDEFERKAMLCPPKGHTRASAMANQFVNANTLSRASMDGTRSKSLFKMKKFMDVASRTDC